MATPGVDATQQRSQDQGVASRAGQHQVFVERSFQHPRVGNAKHRVGLLHVVGDAQAGLGFAMGCQPVVEIAAQAEVERPASLGDRVLHIESKLFDVGVSVESGTGRWRRRRNRLPAAGVGRVRSKQPSELKKSALEVNGAG